jgi:hypothetical protein
MAGFALHVAVPRPPPLNGHAFGRLPGSLRDAESLAEITNAAGFEVKVFESAATVERVTRWFRTLKSRVTAGDTVVFTFSGHGWVLDPHDADDPERRDEILMLADGPIALSALARLLHALPAEVAVISVIDASRRRGDSLVRAADVDGVPLADALEQCDAPAVVDPAIDDARQPATVLTLSATDDDAPATETHARGVVSEALAAAWGHLAAARPSWGELWSHTVGLVLASQELPGRERPLAVVRGPRRTLVDDPAFAS